MAAVLRVKRRYDVQPLEAFVLACKRRKTDVEDISLVENPSTTIVQFAGTVKSQDEDVVSHINNLKKENLKVSLKKHTASLAGKLRAQTKEAQEVNRYKVVNYFRHLQDTEKLRLEEEMVQEGKGDKVIHVVDVVNTSNDKYCGSDENSESGGKKEEGNLESEDPSYVYDLYYGVTEDFMVLDHLVDIHPLSQPVDFSILRASGEDDSAEDLEEDEDSNDENNWRNDYPDSDHSMNEEDKELALEMDGIQIVDENELSSDEDDERYLYAIDADPVDIQLYGESYARYKYQRQKELYENERDPSDCEEGYRVDTEDDSEEGDYAVGGHSDDDDDEDPELRFI